MPRAHPLLVPLAGFALAFALRLATLGGREAWIDEALTQFAVSLGWGALVADRIAAGHSPVYFLLLKATGLDPAAILPLRAASALLDALACALFGAAVLRVAGTRAALLGMALYALHPVLLAWGQIARPYALMMACLALALYGAAGLLDRRQARRRADALCLSLGLTGAALTLTGGAIAALIAGGATYAASSKNRRHALRLALASPAAALVLMVLLVTLPAVHSQSGIFWTERVAPFGPDAFLSLLRGLTVGDRFAAFETQQVLGVVPWPLPSLLLSALLCVAVIRALATTRRTPSLWPFAALTLGYPAVLVALSLGTSLLIPRYFLPALGPALMLAGIGLAQLSTQRWGRAATTATLAITAALALHQSLALGPQRSAPPRALATIVLTDPLPGTVLWRAPSDWVGFDTMAEVLPRALGPAPNPRVEEHDPRAKPGPGPTFLVLHETLWRGHAPVLPRPDCLWRSGPAVLAYWGPPRADCLSG